MKKLSLVVVFALLAAPAIAAEDEPEGFHGMLVFGQAKAYISHLPMFDNPLHKYQGVWEVGFETPDGEPNHRYANDKPDHPGRYYTVAPNESFFLPHLVGKKKSFNAALFRGHFERQGHQLIDKNVQVVRKKIVHFHEFKHEHLGADELTYFLVGSGEEWYGVHLITASPSFDQIIKLAPQANYVSGGILTVEQEDTPLSEEAALDATLWVQGVAEPAKLVVEHILYTEVNELSGALPPDEAHGP